MISSLFTYGTLEIPAVMEAVTGHSFLSFEASVKGYARFMIRDQIYPGMVPSSTETTNGRLYVEVDAQSLNLIDEFEDVVYIREKIFAKTCEGKFLDAYAYIISPDHVDCLSSEPWRQDYFLAHHLSKYLAGCREFHQRALRRSKKNFRHS